MRWRAVLVNTDPVGGYTQSFRLAQISTKIDMTIMISVLNLQSPLSLCPAGDANGDGRIRADDMTVAINNLNNGCPQPQ